MVRHSILNEHGDMVLPQRSRVCVGRLERDPRRPPGCASAAEALRFTDLYPAAKPASLRAASIKAWAEYPPASRSTRCRS